MIHVTGSEGGAPLARAAFREERYNKVTATAGTSVTASPPSGPKSPPVMRARAPEVLSADISAAGAEVPLTCKPNRFPCAKFHALCAAHTVNISPVRIVRSAKNAAI